MKHLTLNQTTADNYMRDAFVGRDAHSRHNTVANLCLGPCVFHTTVPHCEHVLFFTAQQLRFSPRHMLQPEPQVCCDARSAPVPALTTVEERKSPNADSCSRQRGGGSADWCARRTGTLRAPHTTPASSLLALPVPHGTSRVATLCTRSVSS